MSIDPGVTTGYIIGEIADEFVGGYSVASLPTLTHAGVFKDSVDMVRLVYFEPPPDVIIIEDFRLRRDKAAVQTGSRFPTVKVIGVVEFLIKVRNAGLDRPIDLIYQEPLLTKFWNLYKMRGMGYDLRVLDIGRDVRHCNSALSHMLYFVRFKMEKWQS